MADGSPLDFLGGWDTLGDRRPALHESYLNRVATPAVDDNPLLHEVWEPWARKIGYAGQEDNLRALHMSQGVLFQRQQAVARYSWAVPSEEALSMIIAHSGGRVVEVGSGTGYWANLLDKRGADVVAVDSGKENKPSWFPATIVFDGSAYLHFYKGCPDRALFLCWPRHGDDVLEAYAGDTLVLVGEGDEGATWWLDEDAEKEWKPVASCVLPTWPGIHDMLVVYKRN